MRFIDESSSSSLEVDNNIVSPLYMAPNTKEKKVFKRADFSQRVSRNRRASTVASIPFNRAAFRFHAKQSYNPKRDNDLINAVHMQKIELVQKHLSLHDPNEKNSLHNTPLHYAVLLHNLPITITLLQDHRVNSLIENHQSIAPYQLLDAADRIKYPILYRKLIVRSRLDQTINALLLTKKIFWKSKFSQDDCLPLINQIRKKIDHDKLIKVFPNYATNKFIYTMLLYRSKHEEKNINNFLEKKKSSINEQDCYGNTCLHHAAYLQNKKKIRELIANPLVNVLIKNNNKEFAHQIILNPKIRSLLFIRKVLDDCIMQEGQSFFLNFPIQYNKLALDTNNMEIDSRCVCMLKESINKKFKLMKKSQQNDRQLPHRIKFPAYATDYFITYCLVLCIKEEIEQEKDKKRKLLM